MTRVTTIENDVIVEAITEQLREYGARLCDAQFFSMMVQPLYEAYGAELVDAALRQLHADARRRATSEISQLRNNAARLKRETSKRRRRCEECGKHWADPPSRLCPGCEAYQEHQR